MILKKNITFGFRKTLFCSFDRENVILTRNCGKTRFYGFDEKMQFLRKNTIFSVLAKTRFYDFGKTK